MCWLCGELLNIKHLTPAFVDASAHSFFQQFIRPRHVHSDGFWYPSSPLWVVFPLYSLFVFPTYIWMILFCFLHFHSFKQVMKSSSSAERIVGACCCFYSIWYSFYRCTLNFIAIVMRSHLWRCCGDGAVRRCFIFNKFKSLYMRVLCALIMRTSGQNAFQLSPSHGSLWTKSKNCKSNLFHTVNPIQYGHKLTSVYVSWPVCLVLIINLTFDGGVLLKLDSF